jgi:hypothetical protein
MCQATVRRFSAHASTRNAKELENAVVVVLIGVRACYTKSQKKLGAGDPPKSEYEPANLLCPGITTHS